MKKFGEVTYDAKSRVMIEDQMMKIKPRLDYKGEEKNNSEIII